VKKVSASITKKTDVRERGNVCEDETSLPRAILWKKGRGVDFRDPTKGAEKPFPAKAMVAGGEM